MEEDLEDLLMLNGIKVIIIKQAQMDFFFLYMIKLFITIKMALIIFIVPLETALILEVGIFT